MRARVALYAEPLAIAATFGLLVSLLFALMPLMRARRVPAATLMRGAVVASRAAAAGATALLIARRRGGAGRPSPSSPPTAAASPAGSCWARSAAFIAFPLLARGS